jgi:IstB-like ATP binding protein
MDRHGTNPSAPTNTMSATGACASTASWSSATAPTAAARCPTTSSPSRRYERASMIVTSNKPFSGWGEIFGDDVVAAAMIDRLVHQAEIVASKATATASATATSPAPHGTTEQHSAPPRAQDRTGFAVPATPQQEHQGGAFSTGANGCTFNRP